MPIRTIELVPSESITLDAHNKEQQRAIGYLSLWGNADKVVIYIDRQYDMIAHYYRNIASSDPSKPPTQSQAFFTIGAILSDGTYSFHS